MDGSNPSAAAVRRGSFIPFADVWEGLLGFDLTEWSGLYAPLYPVLWWGPSGTRTGFHYDIERYNILTQIRGSKNVTFVSPDQDERLYPNDVWDRSAVISSIDLWDQERMGREYPRYREATHASVTIVPGDVLVVPAFWW